MKTSDIKKALRKNKGKKKNKIKLTDSDFLSTGSTTLNLAITGNPNRGFRKGFYYFFVGDSQSGKTFLSLTCLAEAVLNPGFDEHRLIHDDVEGGALMDIRTFFGKRVANRIEPPNKRGYSETIEEFYYNINTALDMEIPFIYILDSMDGLSSKTEDAKFKKSKTAFEKGKDVAGTMTDGKAKVNSANMRRLLKRLRKSGSILLIINQTRDKMDAGPFESKKTRSGGHALTFYATLEMWSSVFKKLKKEVRGKKREQGTLCKVRVKKNRIKGRDRDVLIPIYNTYGIDDIGACVDFLTDEKHWVKKGGTIKAHEFDLECRRSKIIQYIENNEMEKDLHDIVTDVWIEIEEALSLKDRKKRYE